MANKFCQKTNGLGEASSIPKWKQFLTMLYLPHNRTLD